MEEIKFSFKFDGEGMMMDKKVIVECKNEDGLSVPDVCEAFVEFMESAGFSVDNIYEYFQ